MRKMKGHAIGRLALAITAILVFLAAVPAIWAATDVKFTRDGKDLAATDVVSFYRGHASSADVTLEVIDGNLLNKILGGVTVAPSAALLGAGITTSLFPAPPEGYISADIHINYNGTDAKVSSSDVSVVGTQTVIGSIPNFTTAFKVEIVDPYLDLTVGGNALPDPLSFTLGEAKTVTIDAKALGGTITNLEVVDQSGAVVTTLGDLTIAADPMQETITIELPAAATTEVALTSLVIRARISGNTAQNEILETIRLEVVKPAPTTDYVMKLEDADGNQVANNKIAFTAGREETRTYYVKFYDANSGAEVYPTINDDLDITLDPGSTAISGLTTLAIPRNRTVVFEWRGAVTGGEAIYIISAQSPDGTIEDYALTVFIGSISGNDVSLVVQPSEELVLPVGPLLDLTLPYSVVPENVDYEPHNISDTFMLQLPDGTYAHTWNGLTVTMDDENNYIYVRGRATAAASGSFLLTGRYIDSSGDTHYVSCTFSLDLQTATVGTVLDEGFIITNNIGEEAPYMSMEVQNMVKFPFKRAVSNLSGTVRKPGTAVEEGFVRKRDFNNIGIERYIDSGEAGEDLLFEFSPIRGERGQVVIPEDVMAYYAVMFPFTRGDHVFNVYYTQGGTLYTQSFAVFAGPDDTKTGTSCDAGIGAAGAILFLAGAVCLRRRK